MPLAHVGALLGEGRAHRASDPGVTAGDEGDPALEQPATGGVAHLVLGLGRHPPGLAGVGRLLRLLGGLVGHRS